MARYQIDNVASPIDFQAADETRRTLQNCKNLLMCRLGEVPYLRLMGFDATLYDLPMNELRQRLKTEITRIMRWEPDCDVIDAEATLLDSGTVLIRVILDITTGEG